MTYNAAGEDLGGLSMLAQLEASGALAATLAPTVTLHDVELVSTGTHSATTGPCLVTRDHLQSMLAAAADPEIDRPAIHPGHFDPRFALADGEPAIGWIKPQRIVDGVDGAGRPVAKLVGDLVDVPAKLAAVIPKAYARRSVEWQAKQTPSGRSYPAALHGMALLGVAIPAVKGLADVLARYTTAPVGPPPPALLLADTPYVGAALRGSWYSAGHDVAGRTNAHQLEDSQMPRFTDDRLRALLGIEATRDVSYLQHALSAVAPDPAAPVAPAQPQLQPMPGFPAPQLAAPAAPAAPAPAAPAGWPAPPAGYAYAPTGQLVPAAPAAAPAPVPAPIAAAPAAPAPAPAPQYVIDPASGQVVPAAAPAPAAPAAPAAPVAQPQLQPMPGFPAPAAPAAPAPVAPVAGVPAAPPAAGAPSAPVAFAAPYAPAPAVQPLVHQLSAGQLQELTARAAAGDQAMQILTAQQMESYLDQAVGQGRISVAERPAWHQQMQRDMAGTVQLLSALTPGRIPVQPAPYGVPSPTAALAAGGIPDAAWDAWESETFGTAPAAPVAPAAAPAYAGVPAAPMPAGAVAGATVPGGF